MMIRIIMMMMMMMLMEEGHIPSVCCNYLTLSGVRGSRTIGEEPVVVPNIFTSFQGKAKRQFEVGTILHICLYSSKEKNFLAQI